MADLIERTAALNALCETAELGGCVEHPKNNGFCKPGNRYCDEGKAIDSIPAVDAVEVRHGHWVTEEEAIEKDDYSLRDTCSVCGHCDWDCTESQNFTYCPTCGAKMDDVYQPPICGPGEEDGDGNADSM